MFLHVNVGPRWMLGSRDPFGHRGSLTKFSKRHSSTSISTPSLRSLRLQHSRWNTHAFDRRNSQNISQPSQSWPLKASQSPTASHDYVAHFTTFASKRTTSPTRLDVAEANNQKPVPGKPFQPLSSFTSSEDNVLHNAHRASEGVSEPLAWTSPFHNTFDLSTENIPSAKSDYQDDATVEEGDHTDGEVKHGIVSHDWSFRKLHKLFKMELTRLGVFLSQKREPEEIRKSFSDTISEQDNLWRLHGLDLGRWLQGPWDVDKAVQVTQLLLGSIVTSPHRVVEILRCMEEVDGDFVFRCQCLSFTGFMYKDELSKQRGLMAEFDSEVKKLMSPDLWPVKGLRRHHLSLLLWRATSEEGLKLIEAFLQKYPTASINTRLQLAMYCSHNKMESLALSILTNLPSKELDSPGPWTLRCCQVLLRHDEVEATPDGTNFKFLPRLLEKGLTPDNILYSRIMERALESGYPGVAWDIFRHLQASKIEITGWTYLLLLRHAFNENNAAAVQELMLEIQQNVTLYTNVYILTYSMNIVRRIFSLEKEVTTAESLSHILVLYDRVFSRDALVRLGIVPSSRSSGLRTPSAESEKISEVVEPDAYCLAFTIWAFVLCHRSSGAVRQLWARIQALVEAGDTQIVECMRHDMIYDAFIWLNLRNRSAENTTAALEVLQYMVRKQLCVPTDRTWSILICGFLRNDQHAQAKHIYRLMQESNLTIRDIRKEYWRSNWSFDYLKGHVEEILDESAMPDGTELGLAEAFRDGSDELDQMEHMQDFKLELKPGL